MNDEAALIVRAVTGADDVALAQLLTEFNGLEATAAQVRERLNKSRGVEYPVVAQVGQEIVGFASLRLLHYLGEDAPYAELSELYVRSGYRRRGVARALVLELEAQARRAGASSWSVLTGDDNTAALALYESLGFRPFSVALQKWFSPDRPYREQRE
jgi:ribosomal protein S18 acetylase RimI-like enzyme